VTGQSLLPLANSVRPYAWGSTDFIPTMLGHEVTGEPVAELWIGTHAGAPSRIGHSERSLAEAIAADPQRLLGPAVLEQFGADLPFLLKVLAAAQPLSIQAHPTMEQASAGFAAENERGLPIDAPHRNYADPNHKPELICALTDFEALCGFRHVGPSAGFIELLVSAGATGLEGVPERLLAENGLREVVHWLLRLSDDEQVELQRTLRPAAAAVASAGGDWAAEAELTGRLSALYPNDSGVPIALLMNFVRLAPGEALFLPAGRIHAYLRGAGIELMACSDNVLRSGLTRKHIDVHELLSVLDFSTEDVVPIRPVMHGVRADYIVAIKDFRLSTIDTRPDEPFALYEPGPTVLLCTAGAVDVTAPDGRVALAQGEAVFVAAATPVEIAGSGRVFCATTNL
jgi:mannose-6-phosphate isomerase